MNKTSFFLIAVVFGCGVFGGSVSGMQEPTHIRYLNDLNRKCRDLENKYTRLERLLIGARQQLYNSPDKKTRTIREKVVNKLKARILKTEAALNNIDAEVQTLRDYDGLYDSIKHDDSEKITSILNKNRYVDVNGKSMVDDLEGSTPLHYAVRLGKDKMAGTLLQNGANQHIKDGLAKTPIYYAVKNQSQEIVDLLVDDEIKKSNQLLHEID